MNTVANPTYAYVGAFIDEIERAGVQHVVVCPGSRSTPLALCVADHPRIQMWMHIDERSAAFFALGLAKRLQQPVALVCTSGTAAANFLPAIVEAKLTHIPLLVLTADRPHELRENGAPQSIDQNRLYGTHVKWFAEAPLPEATNAAMRFIRTLADRATALTQAVPAGPVHLNFPFREPLTPDQLADQPLPPSSERDSTAWDGRPDHQAYIHVQDTPLALPTSVEITELANRLRSVQRGLLIVGPYLDTALRSPLVQLAERLGYPILADPLSQVRHGQSHVLSSYDAFLRIEPFIQQTQPELIVRFGAMPVSKPVLLYLKRYADCPQIVVDEHGTWEEPTQLASEMLHTNPVALCEALLSTLPVHETRTSTWLARWQQAEQVTRQALQDVMQQQAAMFEGRVFSELAALLPENTTLYVGNSMPVRDLDTFFWQPVHPIYILGNRGANGIDGVISSALGASAATRHKTPTVLVIGDLSFLHDLNGLLAAHLHHLDLTIVLINNDGGGIFSFLPQASHPEHFEQVFGTPTGLNLQPAVEMYGGHFHQSANWEQFRKAVTHGVTAGGLHVVEVTTERARNVQQHRQLWQVVERTLRQAGVVQ